MAVGDTLMSAEKLEQVDRESRTREFSSLDAHWVSNRLRGAVSLHVHRQTPPALLLIHTYWLDFDAMLRVMPGATRGHRASEIRTIMTLVLIVASASTLVISGWNHRDILDRIIQPNTTDDVFGAPVGVRSMRPPGITG